MAEPLHLELLIGCRVYDSTGKTSVGRIEEVRARIDGKECLVEEFLIGRYALGERFAAAYIGRALLDLFGTRSQGSGYRVRWDQIDLTEPHHIRLKLPPAELRPIADRSREA